MKKVHGIQNHLIHWGKVFEGMDYQPTEKPYMSTICHKGKKHRLGFFKTPEEASIAYEAKAKELFGVFYRKPK